MLTPMKRVYLLALSTLAAVAIWAGCYTNPVTGRQSLVTVSPGEELKLGAQSFADIRSKEKVSKDAAMNARVQRVGKRIATVVGDQMPNAQWEFVVFESDQVNAFALPGGKVGVYSALLKLAKSDDELAIVMGHEIGHVIARHGAERMTEQMIVQGVGSFASAYAQNRYSPQTVQIFQTAYGGASTVVVALPHSRLQESEADRMGLVYAAKAGYDPRAAITFWKKMKAQAGGAKDGFLAKFLSTHPADDKRIADLETLMPQVLPFYEAAKPAKT
jgi:metalloendopeptidase OMA1, mitochondrial